MAKEEDKNVFEKAKDKIEEAVDKVKGEDNDNADEEVNENVEDADTLNSEEVEVDRYEGEGNVSPLEQVDTGNLDTVQTEGYVEVEDHYLDDNVEDEELTVREDNLQEVDEVSEVDGENNVNDVDDTELSDLEVESYEEPDETLIVDESRDTKNVEDELNK